MTSSRWRVCFCSAVGSILIPRTAEMIHVWIVPGAPEPFGDLDDAWKRA